MKKLLLASLLMIGFYGVSQAGTISPGLYHSFAVSSGVIFSRGALLRVDCSSVPTGQAYGSVFAQFFDTTVISGVGSGTGNLLDANAFRASTANIATAPFMLTSTPTINQVQGQNNGGVVVDWSPYGIDFSRDAYFMYIGDPIAGWRGCAVYWKQE